MMGQILDLRFRGKLPPDISSLLNTIAYELRPKFNEIVTKISIRQIKNFDWWIEGPASRNTFGSPFFHRFCFLHLVHHLIDQKKFSFTCILVDSFEFKLIVEMVLNDYNVSICKVRYVKPPVIKLIKNYLTIPILVSKKIIQQCIAKICGKSNLKELKGKRLVLLDTFMMSNYTQTDRWYGQLWENLSDEIKEKTYFVPTLVSISIREMTKAYRELRNNERNFIIKEDFLKLADIFYASRHQRRIKNIKIGTVNVLGYDVSRLIKEELLQNSDRLTVIESILTCCFVKRLKECEIQVRLSIDWFEGQAIDKAWTYAFKKYFPGTKTIGYRAFDSFPFYLCSYPIPVENEAGLLPDIMAVHGKKTVETVREFFSDLEVMVIPSLRTQHVWDGGFRGGSREQINILVTLPISLDVSIRIIRELCEANKLIELKGKTVVYTIKPHPTQRTNHIKARLDIDLADSFVFSNEKSLPALLHNANLLVSEVSSTCLEALACGVPVVVVENQEGLTFDPIPRSIPEEIVHKTCSVSQLTEAIEYYIHADIEKQTQLQSLGLEIRSDYFEPLSKKGIERFFNIENQESGKYA